MQTLLKALWALVLSSSCCFSEVIYGSGSVNTYQWVMSNVIPDALGLKVNGVYHKYTITKNPGDAATVTICNKNINAAGCAYEHKDVWDGLPGTTKIYYDPVALLGASLGDGSMTLEGTATLSNPSVHYDYVYDTCADPITDPRCPGYENALLKYLQDNGLLDSPDFNDPYYNEYIQDALAEEAKLEEERLAQEEAEAEEEKEEETLQEMLSVQAGAMEKIISSAEQNQMLVALSNTPALTQYYALELDGGELKETLVIPQNEIVDNKRALRSLQSDVNHRKMVRNQYE
jgi:hypothetical protein